MNEYEAKLRDDLAAMAMQGMVVGIGDPYFEVIAEMAYEMADAMLAARKK